MRDRNQQSSAFNENASTTSPLDRFTDRVEDYVKGRPGYPAEVVALLSEKCGLTKTSTLVDVGCGTGLLAKHFCDFGCRVIGVEPNLAMREAGKHYLSEYPNFEMLDGTAEAIALSATSVDLISAGQAFHWFDQEQARHEFMRILKPNGWAVLVWNDRAFQGSKFAEDYEKLLQKHGIDYPKVHQRGKVTSENLERFFGNSAYVKASFPNLQQLDHDRFIARILSASYMPSAGHPGYPSMLQDIEHIFLENREGAVVTVNYTCSVIYGQMS